MEPSNSFSSPAEEGGAGADRMCKEGAPDGPKVEQIFGLHVWPSMTTGTVAGNAGTILAAAGAFEITVTGKGGHGCFRHLTIDPIACVAKVIVELQTIVYARPTRSPRLSSPSDRFMAAKR